MRLLSRSEVLERIGVPRSTWYEMRARGEFPAPSRLGAQCVGWLESDITRWLEQRGIACRSHRDP